MTVEGQPVARYDAHYRESEAACGKPLAEIVGFVSERTEPCRVLDLGAGQGRDTLVFARAGHAVVAVDESAVGVEQLRQASSGLDVEVHHGDVRTFAPNGEFDVVVLDRVLHMLPAEDRVPALERAMGFVVSGGHVLVADTPTNMPSLRAALGGWSVSHDRKGLVIARLG